MVSCSRTGSKSEQFVRAWPAAVGECGSPGRMLQQFLQQGRVCLSSVGAAKSGIMSFCSQAMQLSRC